MWAMRSLQTEQRHDSRPLPPPSGPEVLAVRELGRGESLYRSGDPGGALYRVETGLLKLFIDTPGGRERIIGLAGPGDVVGLISPAALDGAPAVEGARPDHTDPRAAETHAESAEALGSGVRVSVLGGAPLPLLAGLLLAAGNWQITQLRDTLEDSELPVPARLARTLGRLAGRFGQPQADGAVRLTLPLTHEHLAAMIGAARETTSCTLAEMRSAGVIRGTRGSYSFDLRAMSEFAAASAGNHA